MNFHDFFGVLIAVFIIAFFVSVPIHYLLRIFYSYKEEENEVEEVTLVSNPND